MHDPAPVVLVTGAARRVGAAIARRLHASGCTLAIHYRDSAAEAEALVQALEQTRAGSAMALKGDLADVDRLPGLVETVIARFGRLDGLVHNASGFFPTPFGEATPAQFDALFASNTRAPFFLSQAAAPHLQATGGSIVSLLDIYAERPLPNHPLYSMAKAAHRMLVLSLAQAMGPGVRVNGVSPGTVLWSDKPDKAEAAHDVETRTALKRAGDPVAVADAVAFLLLDAGYCTGTILPVDGGRLLST